MVFWTGRIDGWCTVDARNLTAKDRKINEVPTLNGFQSKRIITVRFRSTVNMTCVLISNLCNATSTHSHAPSSSVSATARSCTTTSPNSLQNAPVSFPCCSCVSAIPQPDFEYSI
ncbi:unnamed protein product [Sphenostylis stenocarpa]|uniref:Uncharacterized protein n=1 Tax=Sphenostylis stenocarpa TaxID=92480 RepID=A0AA86VN63_9FABA|nr:unnamed protein product [Sphenostylis stenocarpa]